MLALAAGISVSLWLILAQSEQEPARVEQPGLSQTIQQTMGYTEAEADALVIRLQEAVALAATRAATTSEAAPTEGDAAPLSQALQDTLGLTDEEAAALVTRLQETLALINAPPSGGGGTQEQTAIGESLDFVVRDSEGNIKETGSGQ